MKRMKITIEHRVANPVFNQEYRVFHSNLNWVASSSFHKTGPSFNKNLNRRNHFHFECGNTKQKC